MPDEKVIIRVGKAPLPGPSRESGGLIGHFVPEDEGDPLPFEDRPDLPGSDGLAGDRFTPEQIAELYDSRLPGDVPLMPTATVNDLLGDFVADDDIDRGLTIEQALGPAVDRQTQELELDLLRQQEEIERVQAEQAKIIAERTGDIEAANQQIDLLDDQRATLAFLTGLARQGGQAGSDGGVGTFSERYPQLDVAVEVIAAEPNDAVRREALTNMSLEMMADELTDLTRARDAAWEALVNERDLDLSDPDDFAKLPAADQLALIDAQREVDGNYNPPAKDETSRLQFLMESSLVDETSPLEKAKYQVLFEALSTLGFEAADTDAVVDSLIEDISKGDGETQLFNTLFGPQDAVEEIRDFVQSELKNLLEDGEPWDLGTFNTTDLQIIARFNAEQGLADAYGRATSQVMRDQVAAQERAEPFEDRSTLNTLSDEARRELIASGYALDDMTWEEFDELRNDDPFVQDIVDRDRINRTVDVFNPTGGS